VGLHWHHLGNGQWANYSQASSGHDTDVVSAPLWPLVMAVESGGEHILSDAD
jgi:hypothetical protein